MPQTTNKLTGKFRIVEDTNRVGVFRILHLVEIEDSFKDAFANTLVEGDNVYRMSWIRDTDGKVSEYTSQKDVDRAVEDLCSKIDLSDYTIKRDVEIHQTKYGYRQTEESAPAQ